MEHIDIAQEVDEFTCRVTMVDIAGDMLRRGVVPSPFQLTLNPEIGRDGSVSSAALVGGARGIKKRFSRVSPTTVHVTEVGSLANQLTRSMLQLTKNTNPLSYMTDVSKSTAAQCLELACAYIACIVAGSGRR